MIIHLAPRQIMCPHLSTGHWTHDCWLRPLIKQLSTISTIIFIYNLQSGMKVDISKFISDLILHNVLFSVLTPIYSGLLFDVGFTIQLTICDRSSYLLHTLISIIPRVSGAHSDLLSSLSVSAADSGSVTPLTRHSSLTWLTRGHDMEVSGWVYCSGCYVILFIPSLLLSL